MTKENVFNVVLYRQNFLLLDAPPKIQSPSPCLSSATECPSTRCGFTPGVNVSPRKYEGAWDLQSEAIAASELVSEGHGVHDDTLNPDE